MTDEELIARLRAANAYKGPDFNTPIADPIKVAAADRIEALVKQCEGLMQAAMNNGQALILAEARAERLEAAADYILDGMGIHAPDYEIDPDDDLLDAANSDWVRDVLTRLAATLKGDDHE